MNKIEAIIFDMEGVVVDTEPLWDEVAKIFLSRRNFIYDRATLKPLMMGRTMEEGIKIWQEHYDFKGDIKQQAEERRQIVRKVFASGSSFVDGFIDFFNSIKDNYKTAIATSSEREFLKLFNERLNLNGLFGNHIYSIADIGHISKPNPDIYLQAAKNLGVPPTLCVGIEDAPNGIEALRRAGMKSVAITTSTTKENLSSADLIVDSFSEIDLTRL
ncbi:hypothetical protein A3B45_03900 [Candidatus Daviesbacteria bacterium RIFCSPLOWO2_01_FULL_39_12]|uniref:HAD family hydrolase n=1 Tax=Candidatus Daviesbacteria bacterium RIFCSPLOWO2_01_FULL_39_12 TaxID=1797785 RepID=A0A1F5KUA6_9BACT|nr:MAG: hypothetical protein A3D79_03665 [Candidatus Daviesbacteria bacterium RIFCSPHIGHO2_02_FULL_39_8]OGE44390.1 MAG: hypothetical protein A3B45_03900 [Candidatus Daviesbacteria bacterium RIFCSPLOWO2_01_FULL_39_12]